MLNWARCLPNWGTLLSHHGHAACPGWAELLSDVCPIIDCCNTVSYPWFFPPQRGEQNPLMWGFIPHVRGGYKPVGQLYEKLVGLNLLITNTRIPVFWILQTHTIPIVWIPHIWQFVSASAMLVYAAKKNIAQVFIPFHQQTIQTIGWQSPDSQLSVC